MGLVKLENSDGSPAIYVRSERIIALSVPMEQPTNAKGQPAGPGRAIVGATGVAIEGVGVHLVKQSPEAVASLIAMADTAAPGSIVGTLPRKVEV